MSAELFGKFDRALFLVGTVFPDIRYLKVIDRDKTHVKALSFQNILDEQDAFVAGLKYHSLVDEVREKYIIERGVYSLIPSSEFITQALKMYEDEILYSRTSDWEEVVTCLDQVVVGEIELVNQVKEVEKWHSLMQEYFKEAPTDISRKNFILGVGFSEEIAIDINRLIEHMRQIPQIRERILDLYETWDILVKNS
jgi:hypothetical protein